ncbi:hypothetical protein THRCLA_07618 [Thraustotheca clavata]|uniref:Uncharacterized protein n=1 Tax=Thraustotheca clavata TaxID=74557 RepID=A0A1V9ZCL0_9STRA|nr:hypothetical protein THRCLA_07618 [Thraustotheca clavata]
MAWRASGSTNDELARSLERHGVIKTESVLEAFKAVDRGLFVPIEAQDRVYSDQPIRAASVHLSAPHIYAQALEAFSLYRGLSFLNIGSGSGYFSCLVGTITGKDAINHGLEIDPEVVAVCERSVAAYRTSRMIANDENADMNQETTSDANNALIALEEDDPEDEYDDFGVCNVQLGNVFTMEVDKNIKYDRIYVGGGAPENMIATVHSLLKPMGIAIGPFGNKLMKIRCREDGTYSQIVLTNVQFAPLRGNNVPDNNVEMKCYFPPQAWSLKLHAMYPRNFRRATAILYMSQDLLPSALWIRIFGFLPSTWFDVEMSAMDKLRFLLELEISAREEAEKRAAKAESERDHYQLIVWRQQNQIQNLVARIQVPRGARESDLEDMDDEDMVDVDEYEEEDEEEEL